MRRYRGKFRVNVLIGSARHASGYRWHMPARVKPIRRKVAPQDRLESPAKGPPVRHCVGQTAICNQNEKGAFRHQANTLTGEGFSLLPVGFA